MSMVFPTVSLKTYIVYHKESGLHSIDTEETSNFKDWKDITQESWETCPSICHPNVPRLPPRCARRLLQSLGQFLADSLIFRFSLVTTPLGTDNIWSLVFSYPIYLSNFASNCSPELLSLRWLWFPRHRAHIWKSKLLRCKGKIKISFLPWEKQWRLVLMTQDRLLRIKSLFSLAMLFQSSIHL